MLFDSLIKKYSTKDFSGKYYLGIRWRIIPLFISILLVSIAIDAIFSFTQQDESISTQQKMQNENYLNVFRDYIDHEASSVYGIGQRLDLMSQNADYTYSLSPLESFNNVIDERWLDIQMSLEIDGLLVIDNAMNLLSKHGQMTNIKELKWAIKSLDEGQPITNILCIEHCKLVVAIPHFWEDTEVIIITVTNLAGILRDVSNIFSNEVVLLNNIEQDQSPPNNTLIDNEPHLWGRKIIAKSAIQDSFSFIDELQSDISLDQLTAGKLVKTREDQKNKYYWLQSIQLTSKTNQLQGTVINIIDISSQYNLTRKYLTQQIIINLSFLVLLTWVSWFSLGKQLKRLTNLAQNLPLLAQKDYLNFRSKIKKKNLFFNDEIEVLQNTSKELSFQLESLQGRIETQNKELQEQALTDPLTKLGNRTLFLNEITREINRIDSSESYMGILFLDLDRFKNLNDSLGHNIGDLFLIEVAQRLKSTLRINDCVARIGGDEFTVLLSNLSSKEDLINIIEKIYQSFEDKVILGSHVWSIKSSIGAVCSKNTSLSGNELLKMADIAMYEAKKSGRGTYKIYNQKMQVELESFVMLENELQQALEFDQFKLFFQPIYNQGKDKIVKLEALIRWDHPEKGILPAAAFIETLERSEIMPKVGLWVISSAIKMASTMKQMGRSDTRIAINLASVQLKDENLFDFFTTCLNKYNVSPMAIEIEVTESILMENLTYISHQIQMLRNIGMTVSLDDFGTGYSSLSYLKNLPIDVVKIDRSFIIEIEKNQTDAEIVQSIVNLCKSLNKKIVVEGVENDLQFELLKSLNIDYFQGYLLAKPMSEKNLLALINKPKTEINVYEMATA